MVAPGALSMVAVSPRAWKRGRRGADAQVLLRPGRPQDQRRVRPDALDPGRRRDVPARRRPSTSWSREACRRSRAPRRRRRRPCGPVCRRSASSSWPIPTSASNTVTGAWIPEDLDWKAFNGKLRKLGLIVAGGQGALKGKIFRIGHLGHVTVSRTSSTPWRVLEQTLTELGRPVDPGRGRRRRPGRRPRGPRSGARRRRSRSMKILVAEPLAKQGLEILRAHHEVDEKIGLTPEELAPSSATTTPCWSAARSRSRPTSSPTPTAWSSSAGPASASTTSTSRPRRRPASSSSTPHRQHRLGGRADDRPDAGPGPQDRGRRRVDAPGRVEAQLLHRRRSCAAAPSASSAWARSARPWPTGPAASR